MLEVPKYWKSSTRRAQPVSYSKYQKNSLRLPTGEGTILKYTTLLERYS